MKRKIIGLANAAKAVFMGTTPKTTHSVGPTKEVTGMGTGSQIHQIATKDIMASRWWASGDRASIGVNQISNAHRGPKMAPTR